MNNLLMLPFQNSVCMAAQHSPPLDRVDKIKSRTHPLCGLGWRPAVTRILSQGRERTLNQGTFSRLREDPGNEVD